MNQFIFAVLGTTRRIHSSDYYWLLCYQQKHAIVLMRVGCRIPIVSTWKMLLFEQMVQHVITGTIGKEFVNKVHTT